MSSTPERPLTHNIQPGKPPLDLAGYERAGGYRALRRALRDLTPSQIVQQVTESNLRGRGGAGFPTGKKWSFVPQGGALPKYLIVNADEMEPGTFKDRLLLEGDPHQMIEAIIISAYAIGAQIAYIFLRGEYVRAAELLTHAAHEAEARGYLGAHILDSPFSLALHVHTSAGRYMCGEETALLTALEGKRALPRYKPPFPQVAGLWGRPSVVNNVETLCNVPHIVARGADWFRSLGRTGDGGTKIYGASGHVQRPGAWELPMGTPLRELLEEHAGGVRRGRALRALLPGGASTAFLTTEHLDVPLDFSSMDSTGSRLGTGTITVADDHTCPVALLHNLEHFFAQESCGWCTPCRDGLPWTERLLGAIEDGAGEMQDLEILEMHTRFLDSGKTFCAHAPGAMAPLASGLKIFREDFERHIREQRCPYKGAA
jgi:NADH-quinone oxidoreductase subunit F